MDLLTAIRQEIRSIALSVFREEVANLQGNRHGYTKDLAEYLQVGEQTVRNYVKQGMPHYTFGNRKRFNFDKVDEWLERRGSGRQVQGAWEDRKIRKL